MTLRVPLLALHADELSLSPALGVSADVDRQFPAVLASAADSAFHQCPPSASEAISAFDDSRYRSMGGSFK